MVIKREWKCDLCEEGYNNYKDAVIVKIGGREKEVCNTCINGIKNGD